MIHKHSATQLLTEAEFKNRSSLAIRRGLPLWLWHDVATEAWQSALDSIERMIRQILASGQALGPLKGDANAIGIAAYTSGLGPLLGYWCSQGLLSASETTSDILARHFQENSLRMETLTARCIEVLARMDENGIDVTVLKGMHTAFECFPTPGTRPMSDIDLLIAPSDKLAAQRVLRGLGYSPEQETKLPDEQLWRHSSSALTPKSLAFVHRDDPWGIDLHTSTNRRYAQGAPIIPLDELISQSTTHCWRPGCHASAIAAVPTVLFLACHAGCPVGNLRMLRLVELVLFIRKAQRLEAFGWDEFLEFGERTATLPYAYAALHIACSLARDIVPEDVLQRSRRNVPPLALKLIADLTPSTAHAITRCSVKERFMWTPTLRGKIQQIAHDCVPTELPRAMIFPAIRRRIWRLFRGTFSLGL
uniref:nucleotidyltransferase family protein n=1 Tax=Altererythrobacter segetis TaxID=1104773 RepID=UPI0014077FC5|nr:nucleotidyltransferase family protein [Altererythrobacter segetis]